MKRLFEPWEEDFVRLAYPLHMVKNIADVLNRGEISVSKFIHRNKIKKLRYHFKIGEKLGSLEIISNIFYKTRKDGRRRAYYICRCRCGREIHVQRNKILRNQQSCTICKDAIRTGFGSITGVFFSHMKKEAIKRKLQFQIDAEYLNNLLVEQDFYCALSNHPIFINTKTHNKKVTILSTASVDRIDSNIGYIPGNVWWVHKIVNFMKGTLGLVEFIKWCRDIYLHNKHLIGE
jgi:hypothetical protein